MFRVNRALQIVRACPFPVAVRPAAPIPPFQFVRGIGEDKSSYEIQKPKDKILAKVGTNFSKRLEILFQLSCIAQAVKHDLSNNKGVLDLCSFVNGLKWELPEVVQAAYYGQALMEILRASDLFMALETVFLLALGNC
ncbi:hypothetical protein C3L33_21973, partial [Rhododendron williamsianum]